MGIAAIILEDFVNCLLVFEMYLFYSAYQIPFTDTPVAVKGHPQIT